MNPQRRTDRADEHEHAERDTGADRDTVAAQASKRQPPGSRDRRRDYFCSHIEVKSS